MNRLVRDDDGRANAATGIDQGLDGEFGLGVEMAGRLIQNENLVPSESAFGDASRLSSQLYELIHVRRRLVTAP